MKSNMLNLLEAAYPTRYARKKVVRMRKKNLAADAAFSTGVGVWAAAIVVPLRLSGLGLPIGLFWAMSFAGAGLVAVSLWYSW